MMIKKIKVLLNGEELKRPINLDVGFTRGITTIEVDVVLEGGDELVFNTEGPTNKVELAIFGSDDVVVVHKFKKCYADVPRTVTKSYGGDLVTTASLILETTNKVKTSLNDVKWWM